MSMDCKLELEMAVDAPTAQKRFMLCAIIRERKHNCWKVETEKNRVRSKGAHIVLLILGLGPFTYGVQISISSDVSKELRETCASRM